MRVAAFAFIALLAGPVAALEATDVNDAKFTGGEMGAAAMLRAQVLLDRTGISPGEIDGKGGENTEKAIKEFQRREKLTVDGRIGPATYDALVARAGEDDAVVEAEIAKRDATYRFAEEIPEKLEDRAELKALNFTAIDELLGEKYHVAPELLKTLNPGAEFKAGDKIWVPNVETGEKTKDRVARIEVDKAAGAVRAFDGEDGLIGFYPATIGSEQMQSPSGEMSVRAIAIKPKYYFDPEVVEVAGVEATEKFEVAAGPNNPVGTVWIDLSEPNYGIHGTPEPHDVSKTSSSGCVRLTNWDAEALAAMTRKGAKVVFID